MILNMLLWELHLGMNVHDGTLAVRGYRNHMQTINSVFKAGSIAKMVKAKKLTERDHV